METTIVAISTAVGNGGIGIIRMSGKDAFIILKKIFKNNKNNYKKNKKKIIILKKNIFL